MIQILGVPAKESMTCNSGGGEQSYVYLSPALVHIPLDIKLLGELIVVMEEVQEKCKSA